MKSDILSKDVFHWPIIYLKCDFFIGVFKYFVGTKQLAGKFSVGGTLVANGLTKMLGLTAIKRKMHTSLKLTWKYI